MPSTDIQIEIPETRKAAALTTRVAMMSSVHAPDDIRIARKEGRSLAEAGCDVFFVVPERNESGSIKPVNGIYLRRPANRKVRMTRTAFEVFWQACKSKAQICHFHDPELLPYGVLLKIAGRTVIYDVHEDLPRQILSKHWITPGIRTVVSKAVAIVEKSCTVFFDAIIAATPAIAEHFPPSKTVLVQNFPLCGELFSTDFPEYRSRENSFAYVGGISAIRGAKEMIAAFGEVNPKWRAVLEVAGKFDPPHLEDRLKSLAGWRSVIHRGWLSRDETAALLGRSRAGLVLFHPEPNHVSAQPNKLFEYMSAGIPVIASNFPLWKRLIEGERCGLCVNPLNPKEIAAAIEFVLENPEEAEEMGKRGKQAVEKVYNWEMESRKLLQLYKEFSK